MFKIFQTLVAAAVARKVTLPISASSGVKV